MDTVYSRGVFLQIDVCFLLIAFGPQKGFGC